MQCAALRGALLLLGLLVANAESSASLVVSSGNCTNELQLGVAYPVSSGWNTTNCNGTFTVGDSRYCTSRAQTLPGYADAQTTLSLPGSASPAITSAYVTAYESSKDAVFPASYDASQSAYSTADGYVCTAGEPGCLYFFYVTEQPVVMQCVGDGGTSTAGDGGGSNMGLIIGAAVGGVVAVAAVAVAAVFVVRRRRRSTAAAVPAPAPPGHDLGMAKDIDTLMSSDKQYTLGPYTPSGPSHATPGVSPLDSLVSAAATGTAGAGVAAAASPEAFREGQSSVPIKSYTSLTSSQGSGSTAAKIRQLAQDDPILNYIHSKLPSLTATVASQSSARSRSSAAGSGELAAMRRASTGGVDARTWEVAFDEIEIIRPIGEGSFGRVYLSRWHQTTVAVKILIDKTAIHDESKDSAAMLLSVELQAKLDEEASLLAAMRHPNIVQFYAVCHTPPCMLTEYCSRGSLTDVLSRGKRDPARAAELTWRRRVGMALDAALGMLYLHTRPSPIVHRDLKSPNLLVDESWHCKVTDFNLSRLLEDNMGSRSTSMAAMNPRWLAPEVMKGGHATKASDVYSFAIVMWELLTWDIPWAQASAWALVQQLMGGARLEVPAREALPGPDTPAPASYQAYAALMQACWNDLEAARPSFGDIVTELRRLLDETPAF